VADEPAVFEVREDRANAAPFDLCRPVDFRLAERLLAIGSEKSEYPRRLRPRFEIEHPRRFRVELVDTDRHV